MESREEYNRRYREQYKGMSLRLHKEREADVIAWLADKKLKAYLVGLIRQDKEAKLGKR